MKGVLTLQILCAQQLPTKDKQAMVKSEAAQRSG